MVGDLFYFIFVFNCKSFNILIMKLVACDINVVIIPIFTSVLSGFRV